MDDDDPNILLAIQLSLQESRLAGERANLEFLANEASLGAIGTSLPSRLEQSAPSVEVLPRASLSSSELLELGDNLPRLGKINITNQYSAAAAVLTSVPSQHCDNHYRPFGGSVPMPVAPGGGGGSSMGFFSSSSDTINSTTCGSQDPSSSSVAAANANLLGNIMAWFHDMNPQGIMLVPSTSSDTDTDLDTLNTARVVGGGFLKEEEEKGGIVVLPDDTTKSQEGTGDVGYCPQSDLEEKEAVVAERPTQLDLVGLDAVSLAYKTTLDAGGDDAERSAGAKVCHVDTPRCNSVFDQLPSTSSSEWEEQVDLV